jgi:glycosyltransferase involved in cell wall biosynthesis
MKREKRRKICFVAFDSLPLLVSSETLKYAGGSELKQVLVGRELAQRGYPISFITSDEQIERKKVDDITIIPCPQSKKYSWIKNFLLYWNTLKKADADIYIQGIGSTGILPFFCLIHGKKYVKWIVSDSTLLFERYRSGHPFLRKITASLDIRFAHRIIVQNLFQKQILENKFKKRETMLIKNPVVIPQKSENPESKKSYVLWVGTIKPVKQPHLFLHIAKALPKIKFVMIGGENRGNKDLYNKVQMEANKIPNLAFLGFIPYHQIHQYYQDAAIFVNTSQIEGFPNTFLESWVMGTPVISLNVDPDEVICKKKIGFHSKSVEQLLLDINILFTNEVLREEMGENAKKYVEENHDLKKIASEFEQLIDSMTRS